MELVKRFTPDTALYFVEGDFDNWCIHIEHPHYPQRPKDSWYFARLAEYGKALGPDVVYEDFVSYYNETSNRVENYILDIIEELSAKYPDPMEAELTHVILYMGMIAEENKKFAVLKSRIKRLGVHQVLMEDYSPESAANASRGVHWLDLNEMCLDRGF